MNKIPIIQHNYIHKKNYHISILIKNYPITNSNCPITNSNQSYNQLDPITSIPINIKHPLNGYNKLISSSPIFSISLINNLSSHNYLISNLLNKTTLKYLLKFKELILHSIHFNQIFHKLTLKIVQPVLCPSQDINSLTSSSIHKMTHKIKTKLDKIQIDKNYLKVITILNYKITLNYKQIPNYKNKNKKVKYKKVILEIVVKMIYQLSHKKLKYNTFLN